MYISTLCLQIFWGGVALQYLNLVQAVDVHDELILRQNNLLELLSTTLSELPTKDDFAAMEAKFEEIIETLERRQNDDLKTIFDALTKKLETLQTKIENSPGRTTPVVGEGINSYQENKPRKKRSTAQLPTAVTAELDCRNLSDHRLVILTTQWLQNGFNNISSQLGMIEKNQQDILKEIRNTSFNASDPVSTILTETGGSKHHMNNSYPDFNKKPLKSCGKDGNTTNSNLRIKEVICDEGWIVIQRRGTPNPPGEKRTNFDRNWFAYEHGFGTNLRGDFWLGLKTIHELTAEGYTQLQIDLEDWNGQKRYAIYDVFSVAGAKDKFRLNITGYTGTAGNALGFHSGDQFSTRDNNNDKSGLLCARSRGGWWYDDCSSTCDLNSVYHDSSDVAHPGAGITWYDWKGYLYSLQKAQMKIRKPKSI